MDDRILVVTTGGTIGSETALSEIGLGTGQVLFKKIRAVAKRLDIPVIIQPILNRHSEDMGRDDWCKIASSLVSANGSGYSRIMVTHGTDTMAYTATAAGILLPYGSAKLCFTGSFYPPDHDRSDVEGNLSAAFTVLQSPNIDNGVYVVFPSDELENNFTVWAASDVKPMLFDDVTFLGLYRNRVGSVTRSGCVEVNRPYSLGLPNLSDRPIPTADLRSKLASVTQFFVYPEMDLNLFDFISDRVKAVIITLYHSGTAPIGLATSSLADFIRHVSKTMPVFLCSVPSPFIQTYYKSTVELVRAGGTLCKDIMPHQLYCFLILGLSQGRDIREMLHLLRPWIVSICDE